MFSYIGISTPSSDVLISHQYREEITPERFRECVESITKNKPGTIPPENHFSDGQSYHIYRDKLYYILVCGKGAAVDDDNHALSFTALELLEQFYTLVKEFCGAATEDSIRKNLVLVDELMMEIINYGLIQSTDLNQLRPFIYSDPVYPSFSQASSQALVSSISSQAQPEGTVIIPNTAAVRPVFKARLQHDSRKSEIFVDVIESLIVSLDKEGTVLNYRLNGVINLKCFLPSPADISLGLNENLFILDEEKGAEGSYATGLVLDRCIFHSSVQLNDFTSQKVLLIRSPQGEIPVMRYRINSVPPDGLPFRVITSVQDFPGSRDLEVVLKLRCEIPGTLEALNIIVHLPVPTGTVSFMKQFSQPDQKAEFQPNERKIVWKIPKMFGKSETVVKLRLVEGRQSSSSKMELGPLALEFELSNFSCSGMNVKFLKLSPSLPIQRWIRYVTTSRSWLSEINHRLSYVDCSC